MPKEILLHHIQDWSEIDEKEEFWERVDLLKPEKNFGIHRYHDALWTSGQVGIGRLYDQNNMPIRNRNGREHVLEVSSSYGLDPWHMLETVMLDDEYDMYMTELAEKRRSLFHVFYDQPFIRLTKEGNRNAEVLFALSYIISCHALCKKGLKKSLIYHEKNFTAKLRGKINVNRNIKQNTARGRNDKFYCRFIDFTDDTVENRIVKAALLKCKAVLKERFQAVNLINDKIAYCLNSLRRVKTTVISSSDFNAANVGGLYSYYKPVIQQARAILSLDFQWDPNQSGKDGKKFIYIIPYTINMEILFEYYARIQLKKALKNTPYRVELYSRKYFLQKDVWSSNQGEKGIHLIPYCVPDIIIYEDEKPVVVLDAKYKRRGRADRLDSHQLLAYVLLTGAKRCGFILPDKETKIKAMLSSASDYLPLAPHPLRYYELLLGNDNNSEELKRILW